MADRFRVGTGGNWNSTTYWSTSSGGSGGASVPGSADNAIFDSNTPTGTVTVDVAVDIVDLNCAGWAGTLSQAGYTMQIAGNWSVPTGMTFTANGLVQFDGSGASHTLTMDAAYNTFDDLQHSFTESGGYDLDLGSDIRVTGTFTIDTGCRVDLGSYDVYIRGGITGQLVLNGWMYALATSVIFEINTGGTAYIPSATGWNVNGSLTGAVMIVYIISAVTTTIRLAGDINNILIFTIRSTSSGSGATATFYTDNYDMECSVNMNIGPDAAADACTFTSYWGSSTIYFTNNVTQFIRWQWNAATHNLQTATFIGGIGANAGRYGHYSVYGESTGAIDTAQTFTGTATIQCRGIGESWMGLGVHDGVADGISSCTLSNLGSISHIWIKLVATTLATADDGASQETDVECEAEIDVGTLSLDADYAAQTFTFYHGATSTVGTMSIGGSSSYDLLIRNCTLESGTTDGTTANKLVDSTQNFSAGGRVSVGDRVRNTTDDTEALITNIDSDTQLSLDADIMVSGENYRIVSTTRAPVQLTNAGSASYMDIQDNGLLVSKMDVSDATSADSGNNSTLWDFGVVMDLDRHAVGRGVGRGVGAGVG